MAQRTMWVTPHFCPTIRTNREYDRGLDGTVDTIAIEIASYLANNSSAFDA